MKQLLIIPTILTLILCCFSCKEEKGVYNPDGTYSSNGIYSIEEGVSSSEMAITNIYHLVLLALDEENIILNTTTNGYPIIKKEKLFPQSSNEYPLILTIDFGEDTIECFDQRFRKGKIVSEVSSSWKDSLSQIDVDVIDYYMASHLPISSSETENEYFISQIGCNFSMTIRNKGLTSEFNNEKLPTQSIVLDSAKMETTLGEITLSSQRNVFFVEGFNTLDYYDDITYNTLNSGGTSFDFKDNYWDFEVRNLKGEEEGLAYFSFYRYCPWIKNGNFAIYNINKNTSYQKTSIVSFGNLSQNTCSNLAFYDSNGQSIYINLP
ncbi:MAG: hypothetical protein LBM25_02710 [Bacteroidales bacterium]|jgi:hypothetical protein|nr:hypothetical protein [Bacteroidales bacterium]